MSITNPSKFVLILFAVLCATVSLLMEESALAMKMPHGSSGSYVVSNESHSSSSHQDMMLDIEAHYVRDTNTNGSTDTAGRFSLGGMFNDWLGLDAVGLMEVRSKDYLVGGDLRISPVDWFFIKGGLGGYANKATHAIGFTPLLGGGIMARLTRDYYFVTESNYFQVNDRSNISFGAGFGVTF